ncbi:MAG: M48 family metallopeptidase [Candidatus Babeliales bacterium]
MNKYNILFLYFISAMCGLNATLDIDRPEAQANRELTLKEKFFRELDDFMGLENLGFKSISKENEQFIRAIIHELEMDNYCIEIRRMSNHAQQIVGRMNAFVTYSFKKEEHAYMFISEEWFETLSENEKQALVRHELMHLKYDHVSRKQILAGLVLCSYYYFIYKVFFDYQSFQINKTSKIMYKSSPFIFFTSLLLLCKFSRFCEKQADIQAAKTVSDKQGFINLFKKFKECEDPESKFRLKRFVKNLFRPILKLFNTHPELDERIAYIENLE